MHASNNDCVGAAGMQPTSSQTGSTESVRIVSGLGGSGDVASTLSGLASIGPRARLRLAAPP